MDYVDDSVAVRMVRVPVPADGTLRLAEETPVALFPLDTLFKAQVDVDDAPGQLNDVGVRVTGGKLVLTATLEDAETGETRALEIRLPVEIPEGVPEEGGPVPEPPDEDELDWEDEETLEQMISKAPEGTRRGAGKSDDDDDEGEGTDGAEGAGLLALLREILSARPEATPVAPEERVGEPRERDEPLEAQVAPTEEPDLMDLEPSPAEDDRMNELLAAVFQQPKGDATSTPGGLMSPEEEALSLIELLVAQEHLELVEGHGAAELASGAVGYLARPVSAEKKAAALSEWLLEQPAVEELYIGDDELAKIIDQW